MTDAPEDNKNPPPLPRGPMTLTRLMLWFLFIMLLSWYWAGVTETQQTISYSSFKSHLRNGDVASVTLQGERINGLLKGAAASADSGDRSGQNSGRFTTTLPPVDDPELMKLLEEQQVEVNARPAEGSWWSRILLLMLPWVLILGLFWYASARMQQGSMGGGGLFGFSKSRARRFDKGKTQVTFDDVAGLDNAKKDLREISGYLRDPEHYRKLGAKIPRGILLMGPPGTGKTLLAKAVAGEANVPFFSISGSEFIEMFVGVGASRVRDMFQSAKKEAPAIIFIDEIDSVGRARGTGLGGGHDEREQTLNQILSEMDGFDPHETVVVLAATNRPDVLDTALLRPGRFDRKVTLDLPDRPARLAILKIHSREVPLAADVELERLAALTVGFSGADLENLVNEAALLAGRKDLQQVDMEALLAARDKVVLGGLRELALSEEERELVAYHESGHALVALLLPHADPLDKVSIIPRGRALGVTEQIPEEERHNLRQSYLRDRLGVMLGGRSAEQVVFHEVSSGAEEDLKQATHLARHMITHWGMNEVIGPVAFQRGEEHVFLGREIAQQRDFSEHTAELIDEQIELLLKQIEHEVIELLSSHRNDLDRLAQALLQQETLEAEQIRTLIDSASTSHSAGD